MKEFSALDFLNMAHKYLRPSQFYGEDEGHPFLYWQCPICKKTHEAVFNIPHEEDCYWYNNLK